MYIVGYEGWMLDGLLDLLLRNGIKQLVDVRCNPVARRFGFHKSTLDRPCKDVGLSYVHLPELGIPSSWRRELSDLKTYERLSTRYESEILPTQACVIERACDLVQDTPSAFMCLEADAQCCHRTRLARVVAAHTGLPLERIEVNIKPVFRPTKVLITVPIPHPSQKHQELVCTAGVTEQSEWERLYPIDQRYRPNHQQFRKY